jgi:peptidoglycan/LPS O-acetylase OafA/YrhL
VSETSQAAKAAPPAPGSRNLRTLDLLRGLAAMAVVVFHLGQRTTLLGLPIPASAVGEVGVQMFFVLSGFLIATSVLAPREFSARDYGWKRAFRILPLYYVSLLVVLVGNAVLNNQGASLADIATHLVLLHGLFPHYQTSISGVLWTLSIEWLFYGLLLLLATRMRRPGEGWIIAAVMLVTGVAWRTWISVVYRGHPAQLDFLEKQLIGAADVFACGIVVALVVYEGRARDWWWDRRRAGVGLAVAVAGIVGGLWLFDRHAGTRFWSSQPMVIFWPLGFAIVCALCVLCIQRFEAPWRDALGWTGLAFLGLISYSIYLLHPLIISGMYQAYGARHPRGPVWLLVLAVLVVIIVVCAVSYRLVEAPFLAARRRWTTGSGPLAPRATEAGAAATPPEPRPWAGLVAAVVGLALVTAIALAATGTPR